MGVTLNDFKEAQESCAKVMFGNRDRFVTLNSLHLNINVKKPNYVVMHKYDLQQLNISTKCTNFGY